VLFSSKQSKSASKVSMDLQPDGAKSSLNVSYEVYDFSLVFTLQQHSLPRRSLY